jgi:hypothetical protein
MAAMNKRLLISESRSDSNRCTPYKGRPDQHDTYASHVSPRTPGVRFLRAVPVRGNLSQAINSVGRTLLLPRKRAPDTTPSPAEWSVGPPHSLSQHSHWSSNESQTSVDNRLLGLPGPYHRHAIGTFSTCSQVPTPQSLTNTGGGYHIENLGIDTTLATPSPSEGSTDPLMALPCLRLSKHYLPIELEREQALSLTIGRLHSTSTVIYHLSIAWVNDVPPR